MTKKEIIAQLSETLGCSLVEAEKCFDASIELIKQVLMKGGTLTLPGFGKFLVRKKSARMARNLKTGQMFQVDEKFVPVFKPGDALKLHVHNALRPY